jgi:hypothetical protein
MFAKIIKILKDVNRNLGNYKKINALESARVNDYKSPKVNLGQLQASANSHKKNISSLAEVEFQVFSQFGDDGIIQWLVQQLPSINPTFIEFGVENYREANTRFLLVNNNWSGFVMDGSAENMDALKGEQLYTFFDLQATCSFITSANINQLLSTTGFSKEPGILSIDIDGNDYWVWKAISGIKPAIIICEYNSLYGFSRPYTIPYQEDFVRGTKYPFNYYGISLKSACDLAAERGYSFIGCNSAGNNAYFIENGCMPHIGIKPVSPQEGYVFQKFTEAYNAAAGDWYRGADKVKTINGLPVFNTVTGLTENIPADDIIQELLSANKLTRR